MGLDISISKKGLMKVGIISSVIFSLVFLGFLVVNFILPAFAVPAVRGNVTSPATGTIFNISRTYVFNASFIETNDSFGTVGIVNATFELCGLNGACTNYTNGSLGTIYPFNISSNYTVNFTQWQLGRNGTYNYSWYARNESDYINKTMSGIQYVVAGDDTLPVLNVTTPANNSYINGTSTQLFQINVAETNLDMATTNGTVYYRKLGASSWTTAAMNCFNASTATNGTSEKYICNKTIDLSSGAYALDPFNLQFFFNISDIAGNVGYNGTQANPLNTTVDRTVPKWSSNTTNISAKYVETPTIFNITWTDVASAFDKAVIEIDHTGTVTNYSMSNLGGGSVYTWNDTLPAGTISWRFYGNDTFGNINKTDLMIASISPAATSTTLYLNGTNGNRSYQINQVANFTGIINISSLPVNLTTNITTNWGIKANNTIIAVENTTTLLNVSGTSGIFNITTWFNSTRNYSSSVQTWYVTVWGWSNTSVTLDRTWVKSGQTISTTCLVNNTNSSTVALSSYYVEVYNGTTNLTAGVTNSTAQFGYVFTPSASIEGSQTLKCALYDNTSSYYNATLNGTATFTSDFTDPVLFNPTPTNNTAIAGSSAQLFQINVTELNLNYTSNGTVFYRLGGSAGWTSASLIRYGSGSYYTLNATIDLSGYSNGDRIEYVFNVSDNATNVGTNGTFTSPLNVTIDRTAPTVSNVQLNDTIVKNNDVIMVNATITDVSISSVLLRINNTDLTMSSIGSGKFQYNFTASVGLTSGINYTVNVTGVDTAGNVASNTTLSITYDANAPTNISFIRPTSKANVSSTLTINVTVYDTANVTVDTVLYNISNATYSFANTTTAMTRYSGNATQGNYSSALDTTTLRDGSYNISIIANDTAGNINNTRDIVTLNITIDNINPIVSITTPTARQNITGPVNINVSVTDGSGSGAQTVGINISNSSWSNASWEVETIWPAVAQTGNYWNFSLNTTNTTKGLRDGSYNFTINATDYASKTNTTEVVNITIDNNRPSLFLVNSSVETFINITNKTGNVIFINASISDGSGSGATGPCNVTFVNSSHTVPVTTNLTIANNWCGGTVTVPASLYTGNYSLHVNVSDFVSLTGFNVTYGVSVDNLSPAVTSLATNSTISGNNTANATAVLNITVTVDGSGTWYRSTNTSVVLLNTTNMTPVYSGSNVYYTLNTTTQLGCSSTGPCVLAVTANDTLNNVNNTLNIIITVDATVPTISIVSPSSDQNISGSFVINATVNDNINVSAVQYRINNNSWADSWFQMTNATNQFLNSSNGGNYNATNRTNNAGIADGVYNITFYANDTVNNSYQVNRTVRFDNTNPEVLVYNYTNGTSLIAGTYYYFNIRVSDSGSGVNNSIALNVTIGNNFTTQVSLTAMDSATVGWYNGSVQIPSALESGNKTIIFNITDRVSNVGNNNTLVVNITADTTGPTVILYNRAGTGVFANGTANRTSDTFSLNASLSENGSGLTGSCNVSLVNSTNTYHATPLLTRTGSASSGWCGGTVTIPAAAARNMNYTIHVNVSDVAGNTGLNNSFVLNIDNEGPNMTLYNATNPLLNGTFLRSGQSFRLNISASDGSGGGISTDRSCNVALNTTSLGTISYSSGWCNGSVTISGSNGLYTLNVTLNDTLNNTGSNTTLEVVVDSNVPIITTVGPSNGTYVNVSTDRRVWVNGTVYDNLKMGANNVTINNTNFGVVTFTAANNTAFNISNTSAISDGYVALLINYTDAAGNNGNATISFTEDNTPPSSISGNTTGTQQPNGTQTITVTVIDNIMTNATITLNYALKSVGAWSAQTWSTVAMNGTPGTTTTYTATIDTSGLATNSTIGYYVSGIDNATNSIQPTTGGNTTTPLANFTIGTTGAIDGYVLRNGTTTLVSGVTVSDGTRAAVSNSNGYYLISNVPAGTYTVSASATDYVTNLTSSVTVSVGTTTRFNVSMQYNATGAIDGYVYLTNTTATKINGTATVSAGSGYSTTTDTSGYYKIQSIPAGTYTVSASGNGYWNNATGSVTVSVGATTRANVYVTGAESFNTTLPGTSGTSTTGFWDQGWKNFNFRTGSLFSTTNYTVEFLFKSMGTSGNFNYTSVWRYNATSQTWSSFVPGTSGNTLINISSADQGYWVYLNNTDRVEIEPRYT